VKKLAGKSVVFEVKIHAVKERVLPEVTDEWVRQVTEQENVDHSWRFSGLEPRHEVHTSDLEDDSAWIHV